MRQQLAGIYRSLMTHSSSAVVIPFRAKQAVLPTQTLFA
jgi:hypothetical protein